MSGNFSQIEQAESDLEQWLVDQAENGVPELVLIGLLRDYADDIEQLGRVPRMWDNSKQ
jgi:hypothetical protein